MRFVVPAQLMAMLLGLLVSPAQGAPVRDARAYYVDSASVGGPCSDARPLARNSLTTPWCSLDHGLQAAPWGSRLELRGGSYDRAVVRGASRFGTLTVAPYADEAPVVDGLTLSACDHLRFERLRFTGGVIVDGCSDVAFVANTIALEPAGPATHSGFYVRASRRMLIAGNLVHDGHNGVHLDNSDTPVSDVVIRDNRFSRLGGDGVHISPGTHDVAVVRNRFEDILVRADVDPDEHSDAAQVLGPTQDVRFVANVVTGGRGFLLMVSPRDLGHGGNAHRRAVIANNVFLGAQFGLRLFSTRAARVVNNTVWGSSTGFATGIDVRDRVARAARTRRIVLVNNLTNRIDMQRGVGVRARHDNLVLHGRLRPGDRRAVAGEVEQAGWLRPGSRAIDAGDPRWAPRRDARGRLRAGAPDIGAFERRGS